MHQQQQNIIHVISYDNAQSTKIERPAPLSLHLKLHWNYNQQLLQGKGKKNRKAEEKKIHRGFFCGTQKNPVPAFFWLPGQVLQCGHRSQALLNSESLPNHSAFPALHMELQARSKARSISRVHTAPSDALPSFPVLSQLPWCGDKPQGKPKLNPTRVHQWIRKV